MGELGMKLVLQEVSKAFGEKKIVKQTSFVFEQGKIYGLLGRNGVGKTTLFNCIAKDVWIDQGEIYLEEAGQKISYDEQDIGYVHTMPHLPEFMTGYEFVRFFIDVNQAKVQNPLPPNAYLEQVGIKSEDQHKLIRDYSHGMKNKLQMICVILAEPKVLLLDEPLTSFDVVASYEMKKLILNLKMQTIIVFSTHILQLAQDLCDEIVLLHNHELQKIKDQDIHAEDFENEIIQLLSDEGGE